MILLWFAASEKDASCVFHCVYGFVNAAAAFYRISNKRPEAIF